MGMFDSIIFDCPDCGKQIEAQSKSGGCTLAGYDHTSVPSEVAVDANSLAPFKCPDCGKSWEFDLSRILDNVHLPIKEAKDKE